MNARHCRNEMINQMFEKQSYPKSSPSLPKSTMSASGRVTLGLTGVWWRQTPIAGTDASRTYDARCSYRVYVHDLRFHPSHHITTLPGTIPLPAFERFPAFPAPTTRSNPHHHQLQLSQTPRGERSRVCGGPEFRQFEEVFEFLSFTIRGIFRVFQVPQFE